MPPLKAEVPRFERNETTPERVEAITAFLNSLRDELNYALQAVQTKREAAAALGDYVTVDQSAQALRIAIQDATGEMMAQIEITSQGLTSEVQRAEAAEGALSARITQTADAVSSEVTRATGAEGNLSSRISQNADAIALKVSVSDYNGNEIVSRINLNSTSAVIEAGKIDLVGDVEVIGSGADAGKVRIVNGAVTAAKIAANTITANQIASGAVTADELAASAVTTAKLAANAVTAAKIAANTITANQIAAGAVTANEIAAGAVTASELAAGAVTTAKLASGAVTAAKIAANTITANEIASGAVTADELAAGAVTTAKIAAGAVTANEIAAGAVTASELAAGAVTADKIEAGAITANKIAAGAITTDKIRLNGELDVYSSAQAQSASGGLGYVESYGQTSGIGMSTAAASVVCTARMTEIYGGSGWIIADNGVSMSDLSVIGASVLNGSLSVDGNVAIGSSGTSKTLKVNGQNVLTSGDLAGYVPTTRKVNGKALSADVTLSASDVGALGSSALNVSSTAAYSASYITAYKSGHMVTVICNNTAGITPSSAGWGLLGYLPSAYCPPENVSFYGYNSAFAIYANGSVYFYATEAGTTYYPKFCMSYIKN